MKDRIKTFMDYVELTAAQLADKIGVQRSSFSHILNGRNKPSADFIIKLLKTFPDLDANWLFGNSDIMLLSLKKRRQPQFYDQEEKQKELFNDTNKDVEEEKGTSTFNKPEDHGESFQQKSKQAEKIVIFYSDKSYREYLPE